MTLNYLVVIDTNVIVSALLSKHTDTATVKVMEALFESKIVPLYNDEILSEYEEVLHRKKFGFSENTVKMLIESIKCNGVPTERISSREEFSDSKDIVFYEVCLSKRSEGSMIVTGNKKHFPNKPFVVTAKELIDIINNIND